MMKTRRNLTIELLEPGEGFHGDEIDAKSAENWLRFFSKIKTDFF